MNKPFNNYAINISINRLEMFLLSDILEESTVIMKC